MEDNDHEEQEEDEKDEQEEESPFARAIAEYRAAMCAVVEPDPEVDHEPVLEVSKMEGSKSKKSHKAEGRQVLHCVNQYFVQFNRRNIVLHCDDGEAHYFQVHLLKNKNTPF